MIYPNFSNALGTVKTGLTNLEKYYLQKHFLQNMKEKCFKEAKLQLSFKYFVLKLFSKTMKVADVRFWWRSKCEWVKLIAMIVTMKAHVLICYVWFFMEHTVFLNFAWEFCCAQHFSWSVDQLIGWPVDQLIGSPDKQLIGWPVDQLIGSPDKQLIGWRVDQLIGSPDEQLISWPVDQLNGWPDEQLSNAENKCHFLSGGEAWVSSGDSRTAESILVVNGNQSQYSIT